RVRGEIAAAWGSTREARAQIGTLLDQIQPRVTAWFPSGPAAALAPILRPRATSLELKGQAVAEACQGLADLVAARRIIHPGDPLLDAHIAGSQKYWTGDSWRVVRRGAGHVSARSPSGPAAALAPILRPRAPSLELKGQAVAEACQGLAALVAARRIIHPGDPLLDAHIAGSQKYWTGDSWRFVRRGAGHVSA